MECNGLLARLFGKNMKDITPKRSYLLKAAYEWVVDNDMTPYLLVDANCKGVIVPTQFVQDGRIVLNISMNAVRELIIDAEAVSFEARFSGEPMHVYVPIAATLAVYAKENGDGVFFPEEEFPEEPEIPQTPVAKKEKVSPLRIVK